MNTLSKLLLTTLTLSSLIYSIEVNTKRVNKSCQGYIEKEISRAVEHHTKDALEKLNKDRQYQVSPGLVRRAEEYMRAHFNKAITISDLLQICGCSRSVLFSAFRNARGYTPMEFLTEQRLQSARERLLKSNFESSVALIALDCGFINLGRFSQYYRKRFGELPSDTLRKGM